MKSYLFLFILLLNACQSSKEEVKGKIEASLKAELEQEVAREKGPLTTFEVKVLDYEEVGEARLDTLRRQQLADVIHTYTNLSYNSFKESREHKREALRSSILGKELSEGYTQSSLEANRLGIAYRDSMYKYKAKDSAIAVRIQQRTKDNKDYYLANAVAKSISGKQIQVDTAQVLLTRDFKIYIVK